MLGFFKNIIATNPVASAVYSKVENQVPSVAREAVELLQENGPTAINPTIASQIKTFFPLPTPPKHLFLDTEPLEYAHLSNWIYYEHHMALPGNGKLIAKKEIDHILFALVEMNGIRIFVIRGTDNSENMSVDVDILFDGGRVKNAVEDMVRGVFSLFLEHYGTIHAATGHSLGGRLVEVVVQFGGVLGVTFNSYLANEDSRVIHFRTAGDPARVHKGHTDRLLHGSGITLNPKTLHSMDHVKACLENNNFWKTVDYKKARDVAPEHYKAPTRFGRPYSPT